VPELTMAIRLLALIFSPLNINTQGITVNTVAKPASNPPAGLIPMLSNMTAVTRGKHPPMTFRQKLFAASAEEA
jgi:hypothetical protein